MVDESEWGPWILDDHLRPGGEIGELDLAYSSRDGKPIAYRIRKKPAEPVPAWLHLQVYSAKGMAPYVCVRFTSGPEISTHEIRYIGDEFVLEKL